MSEYMIFCLGEGKYARKGEGYQKNYRIFNQDVPKNEWEKIKNSLDIKLKLTEWNEETKSLDIYSYTDAWANWWQKATKKQKESITKMKYFNKEIFTEITGIDIESSDKVTVSCEGKEVEISRESAKALNLLKD